MTSKRKNVDKISNISWKNLTLRSETSEKPQLRSKKFSCAHFACLCFPLRPLCLKTKPFTKKLIFFMFAEWFYCLGSLTPEMLKASPSDTATRSSLHYFVHIVKVRFVLFHLLTVLTKHACQHNSFWGSRCDSSHAPTISLKPVLFTAISAFIFLH